mgnify:CR=1 FL=1
MVIPLFIFSFFLVFNKTKYKIKSFFLVTFTLITIILWNCEYLYFDLEFQFITKFFSQDLNLDINKLYSLNICIIGLFEILFYFWCFFSYKNNMSDWIVNIPKRKYLYPLSNIVLFYIGIFIYYFCAR